ncbi:hypothetical protein MP228_012847 [Amoeboaphelidium protococcarum]|nr:hypothetical protein MP228_012847 [Amoeboaphelidium protococcarum]
MLFNAPEAGTRRRQQSSSKIPLNDTQMTLTCLEQFQNKRDQALLYLELDNALHWAQYSYSLSQNSTDLIKLSAILVTRGEYERVLQMLNKFNSNTNNDGDGDDLVELALVRAQCLLKLDQLNEALAILNICIDNNTNSAGNQKQSSNPMLSKYYQIRAQVHSSLGNWEQSRLDYTQCLQIDPTNVEALQQLSSSGSLPSKEASRLLKSLHFSECFDQRWVTDAVKCLYAQKLDLDYPCDPQIANIVHNQIDYKCKQAMDYMHLHRYPEAVAILEDLYDGDRYDPRIIHLYGDCLFQLNDNVKLYEIGSSFATHYPESALTWYIVGLYYLSTRKYAMSKRYFSQCTSIDPQFVDGWLGLGHAFSMNKESDAAIIAYSQAIKCTDSHVPLLLMAGEYEEANPQLAQSLYKQCLERCRGDNDLQLIIQYASYCLRDANRIDEAYGYLQSCLQVVLDQNYSDSFMGTYLTNFGYCCVQTGQIDQALALLKKSMSLWPSSNTKELLGYVYHVMGEFDMAVDLYQSALNESASDSQAIQLVELAMEQSISGDAFWNDVTDQGSQVSMKDTRGAIGGNVSLINDSMDVEQQSSTVTKMQPEKASQGSTRTRIATRSTSRRQGTSGKQ